jgi:hypothetical protein
MDSLINNMGFWSFGLELIDRFRFKSNAKVFLFSFSTLNLIQNLNKKIQNTHKLQNKVYNWSDIFFVSPNKIKKQIKGGINA